jgi:hypothetical protein
MQTITIKQPQIIILKDGTDTSQGRAQLLSNISACQTIADIVRTTLGPRGMDKLMVEAKGMSVRDCPFAMFFLSFFREIY